MDYLDDLEMDHNANRFIADDERWEYLSNKVMNKMLDQSMTCRYCGEKDLHWDEHETGWRLFNEQGKLHSCNKYDHKLI